MARRKSTTSEAAPQAAQEAPAQQEAESPERTTLRGRLCVDPVLRHTNTGKPVTNLRLALLGTDPTEFVTAVCFGPTAEACSEYLRKGRLVEVTGFRRTRDWTAQDGTTRTNKEILASRVEFLSRAAREATSEKAVA